MTRCLVPELPEARFSWKRPREKVTRVTLSRTAQFVVGRDERCDLPIPGFSRYRLVLFLRDRINLMDEIRFVPGMRGAVLAQKGELMTFGPHTFSSCQYCEMYEHWGYRLPYICSGVIDLEGHIELRFRIGKPSLRAELPSLL